MPPPRLGTDFPRHPAHEATPPRALRRGLAVEYPLPRRRGSVEACDGSRQGLGRVDGDGTR